MNSRPIDTVARRPSRGRYHDDETLRMTTGRNNDARANAVRGAVRHHPMEVLHDHEEEAEVGQEQECHTDRAGGEVGSGEETDVEQWEPVAQ
jgi:hypothetical protein